MHLYEGKKTYANKGFSFLIYIVLRLAKTWPWGFYVGLLFADERRIKTNIYALLSLVK